MKAPFLWWLPFGRVPQVNPQELQTWLKEKPNLQVVDARTLAEYKHGTLKKARHAPVTEMPASLERLKLDANRPVVVLCQSGHRSIPGTRWLRAQGYEAYSLSGGLNAWQKAGFKLLPPSR